MPRSSNVATTPRSTRRHPPAADGSQLSGTNVNDEWTMFLQQARYALPGPLLTAGMLAVTSGIVLQAVRPAR